jgi:hypothetical protein
MVLDLAVVAGPAEDLVVVIVVQLQKKSNIFLIIQVVALELQIQ